MNTGIVKWFDDKKGYGFIGGEDGKDIFVHYSDIVGEGHRSLEEDQLVIYTIGDSNKGKKATNVVVE